MPLSSFLFLSHALQSIHGAIPLRVAQGFGGWIAVGRTGAGSTFSPRYRVPILQRVPDCQTRASQPPLHGLTPSHPLTNLVHRVAPCSFALSISLPRQTLICFGACTTSLQTTPADVSLVSRWDRLLVFAACNLAAAACFAICISLFLVIAAKPRKFAILYVHHFRLPGAPSWT